MAKTVPFKFCLLDVNFKMKDFSRSKMSKGNILTLFTQSEEAVESQSIKKIKSWTEILVVC